MMWLLPPVDEGGGAVLLYFCSALIAGFSAVFTTRTGGRGGAESDSRLLLLGCFSAGVFLAVGLLDLLPKYLTEMQNTFSDFGVTLRFPVSEFIMAVGFLLALLMEQLILSLRDESETREQWKEKEALLISPTPRIEPWISSMRSFVFLFSLSTFSTLHALSLHPPRLRPHLLLLSALVTFGLVLTLTQSRMRRPVASVCLVVQSGAFPLGLALRPALLHSGAPLRLARVTVQGLCVGSFSFVLFLDLIPRVMSANQNPIVKVTLVLMGFTAVTAAMLIKP